jgi:hypothetical protein
MTTAVGGTFAFELNFGMFPSKEKQKCAAFCHQLHLQLYNLRRYILR